MNTRFSRRSFLRQVGAGAAAASLLGIPHAAAQEGSGRAYKISLAAWSLHRTIGTKEGQTPMLEMPRLAREEFGIDAIELVNNMLASTDSAYLNQFAKNASDHNVQILLIMVDGQGDIGSVDADRRKDAVEKHCNWVDIAADFGCHSIRANWGGAPRTIAADPEGLDAFIERSAPAWRELCDYGDKKNINILLENHWGASSYPEAVVRLIKAIDHPRFGTLPDFGNFPEDVNLYHAVDMLMEYAKAVSAKCYDFDAATGEDTRLDYGRLIEIVADKHGYDGYIGIEYEGSRLSESEGIKLCKALLEKYRSA